MKKMNEKKLKEYKLYIRSNKADREELILKDGEEYSVEVRGWIMCKGVNSGKYRIRISDYYGNGTATFYRPRGRKPIVRHYLEELMFMTNECKDLNGTIILEKLIGRK